MYMLYLKTIRKVVTSLLRRESLVLYSEKRHYMFLSVFLTVVNMEISTITHSRFSHKI